jgi:hypothetical protein
MLQEFETVHEKVLSANGACHYNHPNCRFLIAGSFIDALWKCQWGPNGPGKVIQDSAQGFSGKLERIDVTTAPRHGCKPLDRLRSAVSQAMKEVDAEDPLLEAHHKHFQSQSLGSLEEYLSTLLKG